jgi:16S rRNA (adenine1518-N6/adenine1519-N6)-dimethyltransferase
MKKPKLGQNFLVDHEALQRIVDALGDISTKTVVEIGPGRAALTDLLARRAGRLMAIELDRVLAAQLRMRFAQMPNVEILEADILTVDFRTMLGSRPGPLRDLRPTNQLKADVVGNLPYYITSDILLRLFSLHARIQTMVLMMQLEVADRIAAKPGTSEYGLLSATAQLYTRVEKLFTLPPEAFNPPPKVHSAVLRLTVAPRFEELQVEEKTFIPFLRTLFAQKRKTLANNLRAGYPADVVQQSLKKLHIAPDVRAEALPLEKMAALFRLLGPAPRG